VLDPAGLGVDLLVFHLVDTDRQAMMIEYHATGTGGTLINSSYIISHFLVLLCNETCAGQDENF
jgi:hypothetical protein